jgi:hypothetical protein
VSPVGSIALMKKGLKLHVWRFGGVVVAEQSALRAD